MQQVPYMETVYGTKEEIKNNTHLSKGTMWLQKGKLFARWGNYIYCINNIAWIKCKTEELGQIQIYSNQIKTIGFLRWKERYLILTPDYIQFFKRSSSGVTEMGDFLTKVGLKAVRVLAFGLGNEIGEKGGNLLDVFK